jgi:enoyl-CoA hydratase
MSEPVQFEARDHVALITLSRPAARNAVDGPTARALVQAFQRFAAEPSLHVAVLYGAGGTFCAGADLKALGTADSNVVQLEGDGPMGPTRLLLDKPVIAAVEGHAVAGGLELAMWCDLRVAARDAVFGVYCRRWGVPLIDGGTVRLARMLGHSHALDLILTGRGVSGDEARMMGLANLLVEPGQALAGALELATRVAAFPQGCLRSDRASSYAQWDLPLAQALREETRRGLEVIASGETLSGAARFRAGAGRHGKLE